MKLKLFGAVLLLCAVHSQCQFYGGIDQHFNFPDPFNNFYNFRPNTGHAGTYWPLAGRVPSASGPEVRDIEEVTERDREPLGPDYKDPGTVARPGRPGTEYFGSGIVDVDAGTGAFPGRPDPAGDFPSAPDFPAAPFPAAGHYPGGFFNIFGTLANQGTPWWKGPNVCIERQESTDDEETPDGKNNTESAENFFSASIRLSNCQETPYKYECVTKINNHGIFKTFTVSYKCCYGFKRSRDSSMCTQINLKPLVETLEEVKSDEFRNLVKSTGLEDKFKNENLTVFVPSNEALSEFTEQMLELNQVELMVPAVRRRRREVKNAVSSNELVSNHVVKGFIDIMDLTNEDILYSENNNSTIRFNKFPTESYEKLYTVNCARIRKPNNLANNGIVHVIDGVLTPVKQNIKELVGESSKLTYLNKVLGNMEFSKMLEKEGEHITLFAPTDEAFEKLDQATRDKLISGKSCADSIIRHHIVSHSICSVAIAGNATTHNMDGAILNMERSDDDSVVIENTARIVKGDIMATNGVIHLIDTIILPDSAMHVEQALNRENLTKFRSLIEEAGLSEEFDNLNNATIFAPTNAALEDPDIVKYLDEIKGDKDKIKDVLMYHTVQGQLQSCDMNNNEMLQTKDESNSLRVNLYSTLPVFTNIVNRATVNCARLVGFDEKSCGSLIHEVDKLLVPPTENILEHIESMEKYSLLLKLINGTEVEEILRDSNQSITFLAPSNEAITGSVEEAELNALLEDKEKANAVLKNHVITEILCCSGIGPQSWAFTNMVPTMSQLQMQVTRGNNHQIRIGNAPVTKCDSLATNGVVHTVSKLLIPKKRNPQLSHINGFFFFNF